MIFKPGDEVTVVNDTEAWQSLSQNDDRGTAFVVAAVRRNRHPVRSGAAHMQHLSMTDGTEASGFWFDTDLVGLTRGERNKRLEEDANPTFEQWWSRQDVNWRGLDDVTCKELCAKVWDAARSTYEQDSY